MSATYFGPARTLSRRNKTGCIGIAFQVTTSGLGRPPRRWFYARGSGFCRKFCIDTLGIEEAWRRAVEARARHEAESMAGNEALFAAGRGN